MLGIAAILLLAVTITVLITPLLRRAPATPPARLDYDLAIYRNQLAEIAEDIERGVLTKQQAAAARAEIQRRMLAAEDAEKTAPPIHTSSRRARIGLAMLIAITLTVASISLYALLGSPQLPSQPFDARPEAAAMRLAEKLSLQAEQNPSVENYKDLAEAHIAAHQYPQAMAAWQQAAHLAPKNAEIWSAMGETLVAQSAGAVIPPAMQSFTHALELDARNPRAQFYLGLAEAQIGDLKKAVAIWRNLEKESKPDSTYLPMLREQIAAAAQEGGFAPESIPSQRISLRALKASLKKMLTASAAMPDVPGVVKGPPPSPQATPDTANDPKEKIPVAHQKISAPPEQDTEEETDDLNERELLRSTLPSFAAKLRINPDDADTWQRLARTYLLLNDPENAQAALRRALELEPENEELLKLRDEME